ncbi:MAG: NADH-quinone oxidoreductase subunit J [candidate division Zixibacteria bacterium]|nr:NADH-quinone oxidoreductase subunit J [candidate division Zixibacteria bacterium]NIU16177.1 NADH-quinone oxidoreductase subunit J [candidate division Zixibacteria bacterium]NIV08315.1 NADH-quinone oxidoreductase subunit J [candidate division Zixibacteria bacterium]NIW47981.1 NADH-quinone oxidoreductase subunit J [Gammaproteobacteria bacterium]
MDAFVILFYVIAAITLGAAVMVVTVDNLVQAALWLIVTLAGIAVTFIVLNAGFLAVVQVVVYIGAIAILMIFAIMLTRNVMSEESPQTNKNWWIAALIAFLLFVGISAMIFTSGTAAQQMGPIDAELDTLQMLGEALVSPNAFILPFEVASVLLLAALIGAIVIAWQKPFRED